MAINSCGAFFKWQNLSASNDFLQLRSPNGAILGGINSSGQPFGSLSTASVIPFAGVPTGPCLGNQIAVNSGTGDLYSCSNGAWVKVGPTAGSLVSPITSPNPLAFDVNLQFKGPNPYVDVTRYGVRALDSRFIPAVAGITATITAGQPTATVSTTNCPSQTGFVCFQNGDGVVIYGAGATNTMSTPSAPTVTPSLTSGAMNTANLVNAPAGSTTYNYQIVLRDKAGALTAASAVGTSAVGQAALGNVQVNVTSLTRTNNSVAVVTSSPINIAVGATIYVTNSTDATFSGVYKVATVTDTTHFTYLQGMDTRGGASLSATGGTVQMYACNKLTMPAYPANGWQYYVYGRTGGSLTLIGVTKPLDTVFEDYGSPFMDGITLPSYVPNTPPVAATNDPLSTTIVSGAGTTTLTLANNAINSVSGATIKLDHGPNLLAAVQAFPNGYPVYIPSDVNVIINSFTNIGSNIHFWQAGGFTLNETIFHVSDLLWRGDLGGPAANPTFGTTPYRSVTVNTANPGFYSQFGVSMRVSGLSFQINQQGTGILLDDNAGSNAGFNQSFEWCSFNTGTGSPTDYMGMGLIIRGDSLNFINRCTFSSTMPNVPGISLTPLVLIKEDLAQVNPAGSIYVSDTVFQNRAMAVDINPLGFAYALIRFTNVYGSGLRMPFIIYTSVAGEGGTITIHGIQLDTSTLPYIANLSSGTSVSVLIHAYNAPSNESGGGTGMLSGNPFPSVTVSGVAAQIGQNFNLAIPGVGSFTNNFATVNNTGSMGFQMPFPAAPSLAGSAGGSVPAGTWTYELTALDANGNETTLGPGTSIVVPGTCPGSGNCTVTITPPAAPLGSTLYRAYRSNGGGFGQVNVAATAWTSNMVDTFGFTSGSPPTPAALSSGFTATNTETPALLFATTTFANLGTPVNFTIKGCSDCTVANPCASGGTGAIAKRLNGAWVCN